MPLRVIVEGTRCQWQLKGDSDKFLSFSNSAADSHEA